MNFYRLYAETCVEEFAVPGLELDPIRRACSLSAFQFLDHSLLNCTLSESGGTIFPDFILYCNCVPLISETFRQAIDSLGVDNLFYKPVIMLEERLGLKEPYWLALPPRINCLDTLKSSIELIPSNFLSEQDWARKAHEIVIDSETIGNYKIFKLPPGFRNEEIIVTADLREKIEKLDLVNVFFSEL